MKKLFKRLAAGVTAACMCMALAVPMETSADTYILGDVDCSGSVDSNDCTVLMQYLMGTCELTCRGTADVNHDNIINTADVVRLNMSIAGIVTLTGGVWDFTSSNMDAYRAYTIYNYEDDTTTSYWQMGTDTYYSLANEASTASYAEDDRVRATDTSIVQITSSGGTGFIVGKNVIATAAHCLYSRNTDDFYDNMQIVVRGAPYSNISKELLRCTVVEVHVPSIFINSTDENLCYEYDYGLIYVEEDLSQYGIFDLGVPSDELTETQTEVTISGFPGSTASNPVAGNMALYTDSGTFISQLTTTRRIVGDIYVSPGNSGGPMYLTTSAGSNEYKTAIGICTGAGDWDYDNDGTIERYGSCIRITSSLLSFFCNNSHIGSTVN